MTQASPDRTALVLTGGGARGAYQAGVLAGLEELGVAGQGTFDVLVGTSAGAINVGALGAYADRFSHGVSELRRVWETMEARRVFRTDLRSLGSIGARWVRDLSFGGLTRHSAPKSLLDNSPLRALLEEVVPVRQIQANIDAGALHGVVVSAVDLFTANGVAFVAAPPNQALWSRPRWEVERTVLRVDHLLASAAIPVFFPSVPIGGRHFGDGSVRNTHPLSPAIHLGARRIVTVGVRSAAPAPEVHVLGSTPAPSLAEVAGVLLDAVMLDAVETDVAHAERVNRSILHCPPDDESYPFQHVDVLWIRPSQDLGTMAMELADRIPAIVRYLLRGLGTDAATAQLSSYLLFDSTYCSRLVALGREDVLSRAGVIRAFFDEG